MQWFTCHFWVGRAVSVELNHITVRHWCIIAGAIQWWVSWWDPFQMNLIRRKSCMFKIVAPRAEYPYCPSSLLSSLRVQSQVTGVIGIMRDNLSKVLDRGEKLEDLEGKSGKEPYLLRGDHTLTLGSCQVFSVLYSHGHRKVAKHGEGLCQCQVGGAKQHALSLRMTTLIPGLLTSGECEVGPHPPCWSTSCHWCNKCSQSLPYFHIPHCCASYVVTVKLYDGHHWDQQFVLYSEVFLTQGLPV